MHITTTTRAASRVILSRAERRILTRAKEIAAKAWRVEADEAKRCAAQLAAECLDSYLEVNKED